MYAPIPMVPGPVTVPFYVREALAQDYPSGQIDNDFFQVLRASERFLQRMMHTKNRVVIMSGEGMLVLWGALKSTLKPGDRVFVFVNGVFSQGIADMARGLGCAVETVETAYNQVLDDDLLNRCEMKISSMRPTMICAVHCETPSGTLNPLERLGMLKKQYEVPLFYVDMVSSLGGVEVDVDGWHIDLALGGSQKCLSLPPSLAFVAVSDVAFSRMGEVDYQGYDSILPFKTIYEDGRSPYTPNWHGVAALHASLQALFAEGLDSVFQRHRICQHFVHSSLKKLGVRLWADEPVSSPTVTAALVPEGFTFAGWQEALRRRGLVVAGSFGPMSGKVFRLGHMGEQARLSLCESAIDVIDTVLHSCKIVSV
ncbi:MAG: aminotransferase class V-fold PLP-dependent enzyme [Desulfovibrio sp.]|nr:aminotransferase class V-fold PLP-dependent enzyme [Desulfovibrio sp.]